MIKKLINDNRSIEWNILMYTMGYIILFVIVLTPIILIGASNDPGLASTLKGPTNESERLDELILQIKTFIEFFMFGTFSEFFRRKASKNFTLGSPTATRFLFYFCVEVFLYTLLTFMEVIF